MAMPNAWIANATICDEPLCPLFMRLTQQTFKKLPATDVFVLSDDFFVYETPLHKVQNIIQIDFQFFGVAFFINHNKNRIIARYGS